jgi:tetratricopeptide (TPR) repeat protein
VLVKQGKAKLALPLFDAEVKLLKSPKRKAIVLYEKGLLLEDHMVQKKEARDAFLAALEFDENNPTLLKAVQRNQVHGAQWDAVERTLERTAQAVRSDARHRAAVMAERARLVESRRHDRESATELYQAAFDVDPRAPGSLSALKRLHSSHKRYKDLIAVLEKEVELVQDQTARGMALYRIGRTYVDWLGDLDRGIDALERAARELPSDTVVLGELGVLYERAERHEDLAKVLEQLSKLSQHTQDKVSYQHRIGQIYEEHLRRPEHSIEWYERALAEDASFLPALNALRSLYEKQGSWPALVKMRQNEAECSLEPERRAQAFARVAELMERHMGNKQEAMSAHARALGVRPGYPASFKALARLYTEAGMFQELCELYERAVEQAEDRDTKITYLFKIGRLHEDALMQPAFAVSTYRRIIEHVPDHLEAIHAWQRAAERGERFKDVVAALEYEAEKVSDKQAKLALLQRAAEVTDSALGDAEAARSKLAAILKLDAHYGPSLRSLGELLQREGRWDDLLETYRSELRATPKGPQRAALLCKMGELSDYKLGRPQEAVRFYREAFEIDPANMVVRDALRVKLREAGEWEELVKLLKLELGGARDSDRHARLAYMIGDIYENRLQDSEHALLSYEESLATSPTFRPAIDGKLRLLAEKRDFKRLVEELGREAREAADPGLQVDAYLRMGEVWRDELGNPGQAIECYQEILEKDPGHLGALLALESLYSAAGDQGGLRKVFTTQASVLGDVQARVAVLREFTRLEAKNEADKAAVKQSYFSILQLEPADVTALTELESVALEEKDRQLLAHVDAKLGSVAEESSVRAAHHTRLAEALEASGDPSAIDMYRSAIKAEPENVAAIRGLSRLAERTAEPALLEEAAESEARAGLDGDRAARLFVRAAEVQMSAHNNVATATKVLERALELYPENAEAARRLRELMLVGGNIDDLISSLSHAAKSTKDSERSVALWIHVAELLAEQKHDLAAAIAALGRVTKQQPNHRVALNRLAELYARDRQWAQSAECLTKVISLSPGDTQLIETNLRLAEVLDERLNDSTRALRVLEHVLELEENNRPALRRTLDLQLKTGKTSAAADTAARLVRVSPDREARAEALGRLAALEISRGKKEDALHAFEQALELGGAGIDAAKRMKEYVQRQSDADGPPWGRYAGALSRYIDQSGAPAESLAATYAELGRVQSQELKLPAEAIATLERGLAAQPNHLEMRRELATCLKHTSQFPRALTEFRTVLDVDVMHAQTWRDLAEVLEGLERPAESKISLGGLVSVGAASDLERDKYQSRGARPGLAEQGSLGPDALSTIDALGGPDSRCDLLVTLSDSLGKIHPPELERYGLGSRDKVGQRATHPLRQVADKVAAVFGVGEFDLYVHRAHSGLAEVEFTDPVAILVPEYVGNLSESHQVFVIARVMANVSRRLHAVDKMAPLALEILLAAAARQAEASFGIGLADEEYMQSLAKKVHKSFPWLGRGKVEEAAALYLGAKLPDIHEWVRKVRLTAARAALLLADDLPGPIDLVRRTEADLAGVPGDQLAQGMRTVHDLMRFWVSEQAFALRRQAGLL